MTLRLSAALAVLLFVAGCSKREEIFVTPWFKVLKIRPREDSGVIRIGSNAEIAYAKAGRRWERLGRGSMGFYHPVSEDRAVLFDLHNGKNLQIIREGDRSARPLAAVLGVRGTIYGAPYSDAVDVTECNRPVGGSRCQELLIHRFELDGRRVETFRVAVPDEYADCSVASVSGYDAGNIPYVSAQCRPESKQAKCLLLATPRGGDFVHVVGVDRPWRECGEWRAGVSLRDPDMHGTM